jgi:hypothetical protein
MYQRALAASATPLGSPPAAGRAIGTPPAIPAAQPHIEPAPYDVAQDPAWKGIVDPNDHELRNFLNAASPEERQMLLNRLGKGQAAAPPVTAAQPPQGS